MIIIIKSRLSDILISISKKWANQKKFAKAKKTRGIYFLYYYSFAFIKCIFSESDNELETQTLTEKSNSKNNKSEK